MKKILALLCAITFMIPNFSFAENSFSMTAYTANENASLWEENKFFQRIFEKFGVEVNITQYNTKNEYFNALKNFGVSEDSSDIIFNASLSPKQIQDLYNNDQIAELNLYIEQYMPNLSNLLQEFPEIKEKISVDGKILSLPHISFYPSQNYMWINQAWLNKLGLSTPQNTEELRSALQKFKTEDPNSNGRNDEVPLSFSGIWDLKFLAHGFGIVADDFNLYYENGIHFALHHPNYFAFIQFLNSLQQNRLLDKDGFSPLAKINALQDTPKENTQGMIISPTPFQSLPKNLGEEFVLLPPLSYEGKQNYRKLVDTALPGALILSRKTTNPEKIFTWLDYLYTEEGAVLMTIGLEGEEYKVFEDGTWEWINSSAEILQRQLSESTLNVKGYAPYLEPFSFQKRFDDASARNLLAQIENYASFLKTPLPYMELSAADIAFLEEKYSPIGKRIDESLSRFVLGEIELNESTWGDFLKELEDLGLPSYLEFWQNKYNQK